MGDRRDLQLAPGVGWVVPSALAPWDHNFRQPRRAEVPAAEGPRTRRRLWPLRWGDRQRPEITSRESTYQAFLWPEQREDVRQAGASASRRDDHPRRGGLEGLSAYCR